MNVVYAKETRLVATPTGGSVTVIADTHWPADDPVVQAYPDLFTADPLQGLHASDPAKYAPGIAEQPPVEQATAAPGERRATRRPRPTDTAGE